MRLGEIITRGLAVIIFSRVSSKTTMITLSHPVREDIKLAKRANRARVLTKFMVNWCLPLDEHVTSKLFREFRISLNRMPT